MNIYQRVNAVRKEIAYVKKDASVQGYMAVTHDAVTAMVRESLIKHGVVIVPSLTESETIEGKTANDKTKFIHRARYEIKFINMDDPGDSFAISVEGHAEDMGDKAPGKAISYATKIAMLKVFNIETGVNDEGRLEGERRAKDAIALLIDQFNYLLDQGDSLGCYIMSRNMGESFADIYNSAPQGKKVKYKKEIDTSLEVGRQCFKNINQALVSMDDLSAKENMEGITDEGKRLLANLIGRDSSLKLANLLADKS